MRVMKQLVVLLMLASTAGAQSVDMHVELPTLAAGTAAVDFDGVSLLLADRASIAIEAGHARILEITGAWGDPDIDEYVAVQATMHETEPSEIASIEDFAATGQLRHFGSVAKLSRTAGSMEAGNLHALDSSSLADMQMLPAAFRADPFTEDLNWNSPGIVTSSDSVTRISWSGDLHIVVFGWNLDAGAQSFQSGWDAGQSQAGHQVFTFTKHRLELTDASITIQGPAMAVGSIQASLDLALNGTLVMPLASRGVPDSATRTDEGTWQLEGEIVLRNWHHGLGGSQASMEANNATILVDGKALVLPEWSTSAAIVAGGLSLAGLITLIVTKGPALIPASLLTRLPREEAIKNKNRRKIIEYIEDNPGASFREVLRATKVPSGSVRHHLNVAIRSDIIVERAHHATLRYFENHGKFDDNWQEIVLLREPELHQVHAWFKDNPRSMQKMFLDVAENEWNWKRSTAQHRLRRLVDDGLIAVHQQGRAKLYFIED